MRDDRTLYARGEALPQSKLTDADVQLIRQAVTERERLRKQARQLSNAALAEKLGCHVRTIEKVVQCESWVHIR